VVTAAPALEQVEDADLVDLCDFIGSEQAHPERRITYVGDEAPGIAAEITALAPPWHATARVIRSGRRISAAVLIEIDEEVGRAWVIGPWVAEGSSDWQRTASRLVDHALGQVPEDIAQVELAGDTANVRLATLAARLDLEATEVNHILIADRGVIDAWSAASPGDYRCRPAARDDVPAIAELHDREFPGTFATADQLVAGQADGSRTVITCEDAAGRFVGYAAGEVHTDGEASIDFVVVSRSARRAGVGRWLVTTIGRRLCDQSPLGRVVLTVQDHRHDARALYASLGFRDGGSLVAYRSWTRVATPSTSSATLSSGERNTPMSPSMDE
jgi:ribosomal protein S18 acetylase RimI-like enzyme